MKSVFSRQQPVRVTEKYPSIAFFRQSRGVSYYQDSVNKGNGVAGAGQGSAQGQAIFRGGIAQGDGCKHFFILAQPQLAQILYDLIRF